MDHISEFKAALAAAGCATDTDIKPDDRINRAHIVGDRQTQLNLRYRIAIEGDFAFGWFVNSKDGVRHDFHTKGQQLTIAEAAAQKARIDAQRKASNAARLDGQRQAAARADRLWRAAQPAPATEPYLTRKGIAPGPARVSRDCLLLPMFDEKGVLCSLQFIKGAEKRYLREGAKGTLTLVGSLEVVSLCEGFATGATIHAATGWTVMVGFDSAGMKLGSGKIRGIYPDAEIVICADNDQWVFKAGKRPVELMDLPPGDDPQWTAWRQQGILINPGIEAATAALKKVGGKARVLNPKFKNTASRPTDFNDLQADEGIDAVKAQLLLGPMPEVEDDGPPDYEYIPSPDSDDYGLPYYDPESVAAPIETGPFKLMGHNEGMYYYLPRASGQLVSLTAGGHNKNNLMQLAPLEWWKERFGGAKDVIGWDAATNALIKLSHDRGVFKTETMIRGSGVWTDKGRIIAHCGDQLLVDGKEVEPFELGSAFVYQKSGRIFDIAGEALEDIEAKKLLTIFQLLKWRNPISAILAAGWTALAPLSGALEWRPHIYIDGEKGSGKSWVNNAVIKPALGRCAIRVGSGTTEAGLRRMIGNDARPVIMDEMEGEDKKQREIRQAILLMARKASSGESMVIADSSGKGTMVFKIYSMFSMSSINTGVVQGADMRRFSNLDLVKNTSDNAVMEFRDIQAFVKETLTEAWVAKLHRRTVDNAKTILKNCMTFSEAAATVLKDRGAGDQIGPMLAGAFSLYNTNEVNFETAMKWIQEKDWTSHTSISEKPDHEKLFDHLIGARLVIVGSSRRYETQVGEAIASAFGYGDTGYTSAEARAALNAIDIKIKQDEVWLRKPSQHIGRILRDTPWETNWHKSIQNIAGITQSKTPQSFGASSAHVIAIPKTRFKPEGMLI